MEDEEILTDEELMHLYLEWEEDFFERQNEFYEDNF